jgi:hypothetical protein
VWRAQFTPSATPCPLKVRLLSAYLSKGAAELVPAGHLPAMLGIFQKLLSSKVQAPFKSCS